MNLNINASNLIWLQTAVAVLVVVLFLLSTVLLVKREHAGGHMWRIVIGSAIEGVVVGLIAAFLMMPRLVGFDPLHMKQINELMTLQAQAVLLPAALVMEAARNGGLTNVPGLSFFLRPRRRAILVRRKIALDKEIEKLGGGAPTMEDALVPPHRIHA